ncbi:MAG: hypothetical protein EWM72_00768 [Nitrospira sp.]|nr:MAG: hypothetical protein EWM72_00768 [Nitrospira sp.]
MSTAQLPCAQDWNRNLPAFYNFARPLSQPTQEEPTEGRTEDRKNHNPLVPPRT